MKTNHEQNQAEDFKEFMGTESNLDLTSQQKNRLLSRVQTELQPQSTLIFAKLLGTHSIVGTLSLGICDQFGMNPFRTGFSLANYFMKFGHSFCMLMCGFLFLGLSVLTTTYLLSPDERISLRSHLGIQSLLLAFFSLGVFFALGAEITVTIGSLWILGGLISSQLTRLIHLKA